MTRDDYLRRVGYSLNDLPWSMRRDLLAELRGHLEELPAGDLNERLGTPEEYAADLRSAAGLERRRGPIPFLRARRPRNLIAAVVVIALIGLAIGAVVWIDSYQPLAFAGGTQDPLDSKPSLGQAGGSVVFRKGRPFEYGITIQNTGRFAVRVLGVPRGPMDFFAGRLLMSKDQSGRLDQRPLEPFHPFDMKPGSFAGSSSRAPTPAPQEQKAPVPSSGRSYRSGSGSSGEPLQRGSLSPIPSRSTSTRTAHLRKTRPLGRSRQVRRPAGRDPGRRELDEERRRRCAR